MERCAGRDFVLAIAVGNEVPADLVERVCAHFLICQLAAHVRWHSQPRSGGTRVAFSLCPGQGTPQAQP